MEENEKDEDVKQHFSFWNFSYFCGEEIYFSFRRNEFSIILSQVLNIIVRFSSGETVKFSTMRNESSISSLKWW